MVWIPGIKDEFASNEHSVYFGVKQGFIFLFQRDGDALVNVIKLLSMVKQQVVQGSIIKNPKEQQVIQYEDAMPMLISRRTMSFKFNYDDCVELEPEHPLVMFYRLSIQDMERQRKASEELKKNQLKEQDAVNKKLN